MTQAPSEALVIRPTSKFVILAYAVAGGLLALAVGLSVAMEWPREVMYAFLGLDCLFALWAVIRHVKLRFISLTLAGDVLRYEEGLLSKTTRSLQLQKIQDVRVDQSLLERIFGIGTLTLETAGETGRLEMGNVDRPQEIADRILAMSRKRRV